MQKEENIIKLLRSFGLTGNESRTYITLLKHHPATGYELSTRSGIPRSAIYSVLSRLEAMNLVNETGQKPRRYEPLPPDTMVDYFAHRTERDLSQLQSELEALDIGTRNLEVWHLKGYDNVILKAREMIRQAQQSIYLSIWRTELILLEEDLRSAMERGVDVTIFSFCHLPDIGAKVISYDLDETKLRKAWKASLIMVADNENAMMGGAQNAPGNQAVWTNAPSIMQPAINNIILDITLAGTRLGVDVNPIVASMMAGLKLDLDALIEEAHPHNSPHIPNNR